MVSFQTHGTHLLKLCQVWIRDRTDVSVARQQIESTARNRLSYVPVCGFVHRLSGTLELLHQLAEVRSELRKQLLTAVI